MSQASRQETPTNLFFFFLFSSRNHLCLLHLLLTEHLSAPNLIPRHLVKGILSFSWFRFQFFFWIDKNSIHDAVAKLPPYGSGTSPSGVFFFLIVQHAWTRVGRWPLERQACYRTHGMHTCTNRCVAGSMLIAACCGKLASFFCRSDQQHQPRPVTAYEEKEYPACHQCVNASQSHYFGFLHISRLD